MTASPFAPRGTKQDLEEGALLAPKFDRDGLIVCVTTEKASGDILMVAYMNEEALRLTLETGVAHYWSRSRQSLWKKGETSGQLQHVHELRIDCDQDAVVMKVKVDGDGGCCHVGFQTCFYRAVADKDGRLIQVAPDPAI
jgi:phosphoribosyl-AMP cyclohydrolase